MAGCLPEYFPVVLAVLEACMDPRWGHFHGSTASTGGTAQLIVVNGPIRTRLGMNAGINVFGPGNRANATIGRAMRLILLNVFGMTPGLFDMSVQGHPGKYSFCIAENEEESPWAPWHVERGFHPHESTVTVIAARGVQPVETRGANTPEGVLHTIADTMVHLGAIDNRPKVVVMGPEHAQLIARHGWSKAEVRRFLAENARRPVDDVERVRMRRRSSVDREEPQIPALLPLERDGYVYQGQGPDHILLVVAGGNNGGVSSVIPTWAYPLQPGEWLMAAIRPPAR
jgi:hypothetical protein